MNRKALKLATIAMTLFAVGAISIPFLGSLNPNSRSVDYTSELSIAIDLDEQSPGTYEEKASEYSRYFVLRDFDGEVYVYFVRHYSNAYWIADVSWERPFMPCVDFGPDASGNKLLEGGKIRCHDADNSNWSRRDLVWDYTGKSMGERTDDMTQADYDVRDGMLMIKGSFWPLSDIEPDEA